MPKKRETGSRAMRSLGATGPRLPLRKSKRTGSKPTAEPLVKPPRNADPFAGPGAGQEAILRGTAGLRAIERRLKGRK